MLTYFVNAPIKAVVYSVSVFMADNIKLTLCKLYIDSADSLNYIRHTVEVYRCILGNIKLKYGIERFNGKLGSSL